MVGVGAILALATLLVREALVRPDVQQSFFRDPNRISYYEQAIHLLTRRLIVGYGFGSWPSLVVGSATKGVHDYYLQMAVEGGVIGLALFIVLMVTFLLQSRSLTADLAFSATIVLVAVAVNIAVEASFEGAVFSWLFAMFVGMLLASPTRNGSGP